jgi:hypothetical protein
VTVNTMPDGFTARTLPQVLNRDEAAMMATFPHMLAGDIGVPFPRWAQRCHQISLALLRTGNFGRGRVARGACKGISSEHSWIVLGDDCYDPAAIIVDPTLWSYDSTVHGILVTANLTRHTPHGLGSCFQAGMPMDHGGPAVKLTPGMPLSPVAREFLAFLGPLDLRGWGEVADLPVQHWPAKEILTAMCQTPGLEVLIPIDIRGMVTDTNPGNLYW